MISPEAFERTHTRRVADVIRVAVERRGVIGFIDINETMSLLDARALIRENVENAPADFQFVLEDGAPVSARQESSQKIAYFYPCVKIRESSGRTGARGSFSAAPGVDDEARSEGGASIEKIIVHYASGGEFAAWISEEYTFQQLRRDASRFWSLNPSQVALSDADGCLWPEQARILSVMSVEDLHRKRVVLEHKSGLRTKQLARTQSAKTSPYRQVSMKGDSFGSTSPRWTSPREASSPSGSPSRESCPAPLSPVEELWLIFTYYCVNGDSLELECIKAHQFNKLLRDSKLFGGSLTPAMADIIYTSETKGKPQASGKMSYDEFLNALMKVSATKHKQSSRQPARERQEEERLFQKLVVESILPLASRWPTHTWDAHTQRLRQPEIVSFVSKFADPLLEIFLFYARSHLVGGASGTKEFFMSYADYQRFFIDFAFANLQLSSVDAAQVFLAACSSSPFHAALSSGGSDVPHAAAGFDPALDASTASISRVLEGFEGVVTYAFPETQIGRVCMGASAFLDALGRTGLVAFSAATAAIKTLHCVKAVFHHLSRGLTRSRVHEILRNHSSTAIHASKFYSGAVAFNNKFLDMWRYEGSPDYLAASNIYSVDDARVSPAAARGREAASMSGLGATAASTSALGGAPRSPAASPSRRLTMTSSMFEDRVISSGAGRGREALDRLVRSAFLQSAVETMSAAEGTQPSSARPNETNTANAREAIASSAPQEESETASDGSASSGGNDSPSGPNRSAWPRDDSLDEYRGAPARSHDDAQRAAACAGAKERASDRDDVGGSDPSRCHSPVNAHAQIRPTGHSQQSAAVTSVVTAPVIPPHTPTRRDDERALFESILLKGGVFKKYGQWGNPHRRYVWCSKDFDAVFWRPLNRKNSLSKEGIAVAGVIAVLPGNSTRTRYAFMKHLSDGTSRVDLSRPLSFSHSIH